MRLSWPWGSALRLFLRNPGVPVGEGGELLVDSFLRSPAYPEIFGGGDCIALEGARLAKVGVYAVRQNPILFHNLMAALEGGSLRPFFPKRIIWRF